MVRIMDEEDQEEDVTVSKLKEGPLFLVNFITGEQTFNGMNWKLHDWVLSWIVVSSQIIMRRFKRLHFKPWPFVRANTGALMLFTGASSANTGTLMLFTGASSANTGALMLFTGASSANTGALMLFTGASSS